MTLRNKNRDGMIEIITKVKNKNRKSSRLGSSNKKNCHEIAYPMSEMCYSSFRSEEFPSLSKLNIIKSLLKKQAITDMQNYRLIALFTNFANIFDKSFLVRLNEYVKNN